MLPVPLPTPHWDGSRHKHRGHRHREWPGIDGRARPDGSAAERGGKNRSRSLSLSWSRSWSSSCPSSRLLSHCRGWSLFLSRSLSLSRSLVPVPVPVPMPVLVPAPEHRGGSGPGSPPPARPVAASPERARRQLPRSARPARGCAPPAGPAGTPPSPLAALHAPRISPVGPPPGRAGQGLRAGGGGASCPRGGRVPAALVLSLSQSRRYFSSGPAAGLCPAPPWAPRSSSPACSPRSALG